MNRRITWMTTLAIALSVTPAVGANASTGPARGGVGRAWGPVSVTASASTGPARGGIGQAWGPVSGGAHSGAATGHQHGSKRTHHHR